MRSNHRPAARRPHIQPATSPLALAIGQALHAPRIKHRASAALMLATLALAAPVTQAQSTDWRVGQTDWTVPNAWTAGVPTAASTAYIRNGGTAIIGTGLPAQAGVVQVGGGSRLLILNGSLATQYGDIGVTAGSSGAIDVDGPNASWTNSLGIFVGVAGTGSLAIRNGGTVVGNTEPVGSLLGRFQIGSVAGGTGTVTVDGTGSSLTATGNLMVGLQGNGTLEITNGGAVNSAVSFLGLRSGGTGTAVVDGIGSIWNETYDLYVGYEGAGSLTIRNGGIVNSLVGVIGYNDSGSGSALIDGAGSTWTSLSLLVGYEGVGSLQVSAGGLVVSDNGALGAASTGNGSVLVTGAGSRWETGNLNVGESGSASLSVEAGGTVFARGSASIGYFSGSDGTVTVDGTGSLFEVGSMLTVGLAGTGAMTIRDGGHMINQLGVVGGNGSADSSGTVQVQGAGSLWENRQDLLIGSAGTGAVTVSDGGKLSATGISLGANSPTSRGTLLVEGDGSAVDSDVVSVGNQGAGDLMLRDGGTLLSDAAVIGRAASAEGVVSIEGADSRWTIASTVVVGDSGEGQVSLGNGGTMANGGATDIGLGAGSTGSILVDGTGSQWLTTGRFTVGGFGDGTLEVRNGGQVEVGEGAIAFGADATGAVSVDGAGSIWTSIGTITVGEGGDGTLTVRNGGAVQSAGGVLGDEAGSTGTVSITGPGSTWSSGGITVGESGTGSLEITDGGKVNSGDAFPALSVGANTGSQGAVSVTGSGSSLTSATSLFVGLAGTGSLTVSDGATAEISGVFVIGEEVGSEGIVSVAGTGSRVTVVGNNDLHVGHRGTGSLEILDGATVNNLYGFVGTLAADGVGQVLVDGAGSAWNNDGNLHVGYGGDGSLTVSNGGAVVSSGGSAGFFAGGTGTVLVEGTTSRFDAGDLLVVGGAGSGTLTVTDGGEVSASEVTLAERAGSTGTINIGTGGVAGVLDTATITGGAGTAAVNFNHSDDVVFDPLLAGSLVVNKLGDSTTTFLADSDYSGLTTIDGGILQLGDGGTSGGVSGDIANEALLLINRSNAYDYAGSISGSGNVHHIGSGTTTFGGTSSYTGATQVQAGTLLVEGSLGDTATTVFSGATLGGTGSIAGDVVINDGATIAPGTSPGTLTVGSLFLSSGSILDYELGQAGVIGSGINDLIEINGDLTLDGTMHITDAGGFGAGVYRVMNYGGAFTDNGLELGSLPTGFNTGNLFVQTSIVGQVNLINSAGVSLNFWDGAAGPTDDGIIQGGDGQWVSNDRSWTNPDGSLNGNWNQGFAVFGGVAGTVTVIGEQAFTGMQFMTDGYRLEQGTDGALRANGVTNLRVDPNVTATIATPIVGDATLVKVDEGTLVLEGAFGYTGGITVNGGRLIGDTGNLLGDILNRAELEFAQADDGSYGNVISGDGRLIKSSDGTLTLTGSNTYTGGTTIEAGTLQVGDGGNSGGVTGDIANDAVLLFNRGNAYDYLGAISGSGDVHQIGNGTLMLSGVSSYTGATHVQTGTLLVEGSLGDTTTTVFSGATLGGTGAIAGDVIVHDGATLSPGASGVGRLTVGSLLLSEGALLEYEFGQASVIGSGINDLIEIDGALTLDGTINITDAGGFGAGVYRVMNYGGAFTDNGLDLGSLPTGFTTGNLFVQTAIVGQVNLINSAGVSLNFWDGAAGPTDDGIIQGGDGQWVSNGRSWTNLDGSLNGNWNEGFAVFGGAAGTVTVIGEQAFAGMQFMTDGYRLEQGTDGALRANGVTNLRVDPNVTATIATPIVGDATLVKVDEGTLVLEGAFGYTGGVTVNGGRLVGDTSNLLGDILNRAALEFAQADDGSHGNVVSGDGRLIKSAAGTLTLTGANSYTGGTTIEAGTLQVGNGGTSGSLVGDVEIQSDGTLAFDRSDSLSFAGAFSGDGALDKFGAGTLTLSGDSSAYAGQATLHTGGLRVDGSLGGSLDVLAGTTLSGRGTLDSVDNAGTISPDGTLSFTGDYLHRDGATYTVDIAPNGSGDLLDIVGTATIEGGEVFVIKAPGQYAGGSRYTIVDADGGVVGSFDALDQNLPFLDLILSYDPNHVYLDIRRNDTEFGSICGTGGTFNQCEVAKTLDSFDPTTPPTADLGEMVEQMTGLDMQGALAAFDRMSGEAHPSLAGIVLEGHALYGQTVTRRMAERREAVGADRLHSGAWVRGYGASSELDGDGNAHAADWDLHGVAAGFDTWGSEHWLIGASANVMRLDAEFRPGDRGEVDAKNLSLYTSFQGERAYLDAVASYAWWDNDVTRAVQVGDIDRTATSEYGSHRFATYLEGGWTFNVGERALLQPMLTLQYDNLASQAFREEGAQDLSLIGRSDSVERLTIGAGARWSNTFQHGDWTLEPTAQVRWLHGESDEYAEFDVAFSGAPDEGYRLPEFGWRVRGVTLPEDRGLIGVGLAARNDNLDLFVDYDYQTGDGFKAHNLGAGLRYRW